MTVIDLGERWDAPVSADPGRGRVVRRWGPALLVLLCLAVLAGGAPLPAPAVGVTVPARPEARAVPLGDLLLVIDQAGPDRPPGADPPRGVAAHRLPTGRPLWRIPLPPSVETLSAVRVGDLVLLGVVGGQHAAPLQVVALRAADGAERWRVAGRLLGATPAGHPLVLTFPEAGPGAGMLRMLDSATGAARWSVPVSLEAVSSRERAGRVDLLAVLDGRRLELRDPETGRLLRAVDLPGAGAPRVLGVTDDLVLLFEGSGIVAGYETATLRLRWRLPRGPADKPDGYPCGTMICLDDGGSGLLVLDPATGRTRWRADRGTWLVPVGHRLVAARGTFGGPGDLSVLDAVTGRPVRSLGRWQFGPGWVEDGRPTVHRRQRDGRVLVARIDPATGDLRVLAALHDVVGECDTHRSVIVCRREGGAFGIWELRDDG